MLQALPHHLLFLFFPAAMAMAAATDLLTQKIPNRLSLALALGYFAIAPLAGVSWTEIGMHVLCGLAVLALTFGLFSFRLIGGGDAKLVAATALWFGWTPLPDYGFAFAVIGGVLALVALFARRFALPAALASQAWIVRWYEDKVYVPYGLALALGALLTYPETQLWSRLAVV